MCLHALQLTAQIDNGCLWAGERHPQKAFPTGLNVPILFSFARESMQLKKTLDSKGF
jgi:hypothetical protein